MALVHLVGRALGREPEYLLIEAIIIKNFFKKYLFSLTILWSLSKNWALIHLFTELDKAMVLWWDWLVFCDYGFRVSALWCPLAAPTISLGFLLPRTWGISSWLLQQSAAPAPYLGRGVSSHGCPSWPWTWSSSSWTSCAHAAMAPWRWGCSSWPPPHQQAGVATLRHA